MLMDQMEETGYKVGAENEEDIFKNEEDLRKKRKEEGENVEMVEDEEVLIKTLKILKIKMTFVKIPTRASLRRQADIMLQSKERGRVVKRK